MCGIAGVLFADPDRAPAPGTLSALGAAIAHRGPDGEGFLAEPGVGLVHRRLSIIDLAGGGQPIGNEDGSVQIVFNGEIYNYQALRRDLEAAGHRFKTNSDTETLVHLYEDLGERMVDELRGMFAFAIWDRRRRRLLLARDRVGIKPLYVYRDADKLIFGSELKAILAFPGVNPAVDPAAVEDFLAFGVVPGPRSIFREIVKLPPACTLLVEPGRLAAEPRRYWQLRIQPDERLSADEWVEAVRSKFEEAVRLHLIADVPVGAFLSGGLDSSAVVAAAARQTSEPLQTFSIGYDEAGFCELPHARAVADLLKTRHTELVVRPDAVALVDELTHYYDEPFADASAVPTYLVAKLAAKHVKVVLTGDGGDEAFGGYARYAHDLKEAAVRRWLPGWVRRGVLAPVANAWPRTDWLPRPLRAKSALTNVARDPADAYAHTLTQCRTPDRRRLLSAAVRAGLNGHDPEAPVRVGYGRAPAGDALAGMIAADVETLLPDDFLVKVDRATMAAGLEARPPLLDHELLELCGRVPSRFKVRGGETKWLFKRVCEKHYLPRDVICRKKHGFDVPTGEWLRGPLRGMFEETVLDPNGRVADLIDPAEARRLFDQHLKGVQRGDQVLWSLLVLTHWTERYLTPATSGIC